MSYLSANSLASYNESSMPLNEDTKTILHNLWTRFFFGNPHALNAKSWSWFVNFFLSLPINPVNPYWLLQFFASIAGFTDKIDVEYFNSMYHFDESMRNKILSWCKKNNGFKIDSDSKRYLTGFLGDFSVDDNMVGTTNVRLATRGIGKGVLTTATACIPIIDKDGFYCVYPTFNSNKILDLKVLCANYDKNSLTPSFFVKTLKEFDSVSEKSYKNII